MPCRTATGREERLQPRAERRIRIGAGTRRRGSGCLGGSNGNAGRERDGGRGGRFSHEVGDCRQGTEDAVGDDRCRWVSVCEKKAGRSENYTMETCVPCRDKPLHEKTYRATHPSTVHSKRQTRSYDISNFRVSGARRPPSPSKAPGGGPIPGGSGTRELAACSCAFRLLISPRSASMISLYCGNGKVTMRNHSDWQEHVRHFTSVEPARHGNVRAKHDQHCARGISNLRDMRLDGYRVLDNAPADVLGTARVLERVVRLLIAHARR